MGVEPGREGHEMVREVEFTSETQSLRGKIFSPEHPNEHNPGLLFIHGWRGDQAGKAECAAEATSLGYVAMTFDLRGHGASEGDMQSLNIENFMNDVTAAYDRLAEERGVDANRITVVGNSFGSYLAALLVQRRSVEKLVLQAPANYPDDIVARPVAEYTGTKPISEWRQLPLEHAATASLDSVHAFKGDVLVVESELDAFVPHQTTENYVQAVEDKSRVRHEVLLGAPHSLKDPNLRMQYQNILLSWLQETSKERVDG